MSAITSSGVDKYTSQSTAELDSNADTIVLGNKALVIQDTGQSTEVNEFSSELRGISKVPVVASVLACNFPFTLESYLLVMQKSLHIPSMKNNLIPPLIIREVVLNVRKVPNIHCD